MALRNNSRLGDDYNCFASGNNEHFYLTHYKNGRAPDDVVLSVRFTSDDIMQGSVHLTRERVADLATSLLFWLDQTDPDKEAQ